MMNKYFKDKTPDIAAILIVIGAVFLVFRGLIEGKIIATNDAGTNDLLYFSFPVRFLYGEALKAGELLQWTPYINAGFPVFAEGQNGFLYPFNLITCYLLNPFQAMNWFIIFHAVLAGIGVYFFSKKISGSGWNSIPAAVAASVCGSITTGHTRHMNIFAVIALTPWLFLFAESYVRKLKISSALLFGSVLGLMLLVNHPQYSFIGGFIAVLYLFLRFWFDEKKINYYWKNIALFLLTALVVSLAIGFVQMRDTIQLSSFSIRSKDALTAAYLGMGSLPWNGLMTFLNPYYLGNAGDGTFKLPEVYLFWEYFHYISIALVVLALVAVLKTVRTNSYVKIFLIVSVLCFLFSLGENLKLYKIFSVFPLVSAFRFPSRWLFGTELTLIFMSTFGLQYIIGKITESKKERRTATTGKGKKKTVSAPVKSPSVLSSRTSVLSSRTSVLSSRTSVLSSRTRFGIFIVNKPYIPGLAISLIVIFDIYFMTGRGVTTADKEIFFPANNKSVSSLNINEFSRVYPMGDLNLLTNIFEKSKGWEGNKSMYRLAANILPPNLNAYYHIRAVSGYINLTPHYMYEVWGDMDHPGIIKKNAALRGKNLETTPAFIKLARMWSVKDFLTIFNVSEPFTMKSDTLGIKHYELAEVFPRAWIVKDFIATPADNKNSAELLVDNNFNPLEKAIVNGDAPVMPTNSENSKAEITEGKNHSLKIKASSPGLVVVNDSWYPKWKARINGQEVPVLRVNNSMRGVISPSAGAEIDMYYDEGNLKLYLMLSMLILAGVYGYGIFDYFRKKTN